MTDTTTAAANLKHQLRSAAVDAKWQRNNTRKMWWITQQQKQNRVLNGAGIKPDTKSLADYRVAI